MRYYGNKYVRDFLQHLVAAEIANSSISKNAIFKGGTMLRCTRADYRFSEDLDYDIRGISSSDFLESVDMILTKISKQHDVDMWLDSNYSNPLPPINDTPVIFWQTSKEEDYIVLEYRELSNDNPIETAILRLQPRYPEITNTSPVLCYTEDQVLCSKFNCLSNRQKGRDIYDFYFLAKSDKNMTLAWDKYISTLSFYEKVAVEPDKLVISLKKRRNDFAEEWVKDQRGGFILPTYNFQPTWDFMVKKIKSLPGMLRL